MTTGVTEARQKLTFFVPCTTRVDSFVARANFCALIVADSRRNSHLITQRTEATKNSDVGATPAPLTASSSSRPSWQKFRFDFAYDSAALGLWAQLPATKEPL